MTTKSALLAGVLAISSIALTGAAPGGDKKDEKSAAADAKKDDATKDEGDKKGPPFGEAPKKADEPKPAERTWTVKSGEFEIVVLMKPGIPDPDQLTEITIKANAIPKTPHPRFGNRVPLEDANLVVDVESPAHEKVGRYLAHAVPLASGQYGLHVTPKQEGLYTLGIRGTSADGKQVQADVKLPVKVWPLPDELKGAGDADKGSRRPVKN